MEVRNPTDWGRVVIGVGVIALVMFSVHVAGPEHAKDIITDKWVAGIIATVLGGGALLTMLGKR